MSVTVLYLGPLRDIAGGDHSVFAAPPGELDWTALLAMLEDRVAPALAEAVRDPRIKVAVNGVVAGERAGLVFRDGDEIALLPPVSGG